MSSFAMDFPTFVKDSNLVALGIAFLIAQATLDVSKSFVSSLVMPLIDAVRTFKAPKVHVSSFVGTTLTFGITLLVAFILIKAFKLQKKPLVPQTVIVANAETKEL